jgi:hypothetical protein
MAPNKKSPEVRRTPFSGSERQRRKTVSFRIRRFTDGLDVHIALVWHSTPHGFKPTEMTVRTLDTPISSDLLRVIPMGQMLRLAENETLRTRMRPTTKQLAAGSRNRGSRLPEELLERVTALWHEAGNQKVISRDRYIAAKLGITHAQARQRVYQCRQRGLLPHRTKSIPQP